MMFLTKFTTYLFLFMQACSARPISDTCDFTCESTCVTCTSIDEHRKITLDLSACKNGDTLSWLACGHCDSMDVCDGTSEGLKCNEVTTVSYYIDPEDDSDMVRVQVHDGRLAGNVDCTQEICYGGSGTSCGSVSGVCNFDIPLSSCPILASTPDDGEDDYGGEQSIPCASDSECLSLPCGEGKCIEGFCTIVALPFGTVCRSAMDLCDEVETCNGISPFCPFEDRKKPAGTLCRASAGSCDQADVCDGSSDICEDVKVSAGTVCRPAILGPDGTSCDVLESCTGQDNECPQDVFLSTGSVCRSAEDACDVAETCSGASVSCPTNVRKDYATSMKCADTCYTCGASPSEFGQTRGGASILGGCTIGKCKTFIALPWPECESTCATPVCNNNRGLSNVAHYECDKNNGNWMCLDKTDITASTQFPICP